jgi:hypothetical protein
MSEIKVLRIFAEPGKCGIARAAHALKLALNHPIVDVFDQEKTPRAAPQDEGGELPPGAILTRLSPSNVWRHAITDVFEESHATSSALRFGVSNGVAGASHDRESVSAELPAVAYSELGQCILLMLRFLMRCPCRIRDSFGRETGMEIDGIFS